MPNVVCPSCGTTLAVTEAMLGGEVQCGFCQQVFRTTKAPPPPPPKRATRTSDDDERARPASRRDRARDVEEEEADTRRRRPRREDDDGDEYADRRRRRVRSRRDEDDDDYDRRRRGSRRYEDDDDDDNFRDREGAGNGAAITSMILGIIAIAVELPATIMTSLTANPWCGAGLCLSWPVHVLGIGLAIPAVILGVLGQGKPASKSMAMAGLATSIIALVLALISVVLIASRPRFPF